MDHIKTLVPEEVRKEMVDARISKSARAEIAQYTVMERNRASIYLLKLLVYA